MHLRDALARARTLYQKGEFLLGLELLESNTRSTLTSHAIAASGLSESEIFNVYDLRAVLYEKCNFLQKAKLDSQRLIKLDPNDPRGYLRLGRIYLMSDQVAKAEIVYRKASRRIKPQHPSYSMILRLHNKCHVKLAVQSQVRRDPLDALPSEVVLMVLKLADLSLSELLCLRFVSKHWRDYIESEPSLWCRLIFQSEKYCALGWESINSLCALSGPYLELNFTQVAIKKPEETFKSLIRSYGYKITRLNIVRSSFDYPTPCLKTIREAGKTLPLLTHISMNSDCLDQDLSWALSSLPCLEEIEMFGSPRAEPPRLAKIPPTHPPNLSKVAVTGHSGLICLLDSYVHGLSTIPSLRHFELHRVVPAIETVYPLLLNKNLKKFGFTSQGSKASSPLRDPPEFVGELSSLTLNSLKIDYFSTTRQHPQPLEYLEFKWCDLSRSCLPDILHYYSCASTLETLVIHQSFVRPPTTMYRPVFARLKTLQYTGMPDLDQLTLQWIAHTMPVLKQVNLDGSNISGPSAIALARLGVRHIRCRGCPISVSSLEWLKEQEVRVVS